MESNRGVIYILTNPSFPDYVKIGYADDVGKRLKQLNRSECIPFAFRLYAFQRLLISPGNFCLASLRRIRCTALSTDFSLLPSASAICLYDSPSRYRKSTFVSKTDKHRENVE